MHENTPPAKFVAPPVPPTLVHRTALLDLLGNTSSTTAQDSWCKLVLVCAPAGYGKTTLLADFVHTHALAACWLHLDSAERDPMRFLRMLLASIQQRVPAVNVSFEIEQGNAPSSEKQVAHAHTFIDRLAEELDSVVSEPMALIVCNYEVVNEEPQVTEAVEYLLERLPQHCMLIVESRAIPSFNFSRLIARQQVFGLGIEHLRFSAEHIFELAQLLPAASISMQQAEAIARAYDGWITGILLGTQLTMLPGMDTGIHTGIHPVGHPALPFHIDQASAPFEPFQVEHQQQALLHYLMNDIFQQHEQMYTFLRDLSILPQMQPERCNQLLAIDDAEQRLQQIEQKGLFVTHRQEQDSAIADGQSGLTYICHHTLRELLMHDLQAREPERWRQLHRRASQLAAQANESEEAITHALAAEDYPFAASLIIENARALLHRGCADRVATWIDVLPPSWLEKSVPLLSVRASIHLMHDELQKASTLTEKALETLETLTEDEGPSSDTALHAELFIIRASILFRTGEYVLAQEWCQQALELLPTDESEQRTQAYQMLGACNCLLGHCQAGILHLQQALHLQKRTVVSRQAALLHMYLANAYNITGNYALAEHHRSRAQHQFEQLHDTQGTIDSLIGMGTTRRLRGALVEARELFEQALHLAQQSHAHSSQAYALLNLSEIAQDQQDYSHALVLAEDGQHHAELVHDTYLSNSLLGSLALSYLFLNDSASAQLYVDSMSVAQQSTGDHHGIEEAQHQLMQGMILFEQHKVEQARKVLTELDTALSDGELTQLRIRVLIYLAACYLALDDRAAMHTTIKRAMALVRQQNGEHLARIELGRLPALMEATQAMPQIAYLWHDEGAEGEDEANIDTAGRLEVAPPVPPVPPAPPAPPVPPVPPRETTPSRSGQEAGITNGQTSTKHIAIYAFGEPAVLINDEAVTHWRMARAMELFFFLLNAQRPVHKEHIVTAFWPEGDEHAEQNIRTTVYHLRRAIGEQCVVYHAGTYTLQLDAVYTTVFYDVAQFLQDATEAEHLREDDEQAAQERYQHMIELYKGDYAQSFYLDWSLETRRQLRDLYLDAQQQLALIAWGQGEYAQSIEHWRHILALDECREMAHEGIMRCYLKMGQREQASRQYRVCERTLSEELGIAPGSSLQKLYQKMIQ